jgi:hypothetical protein
MNLWIAFIGGLIVGWLIEWLIDWYYWRKGVAEFYATEGELRRRLAAAETEKAEALQAQEELRQQLQTALDDIQTLNVELTQLRRAQQTAGTDKK